MTLQVPNLVQGVGIPGTPVRLSWRPSMRWIAGSAVVALICLVLWLNRQPLLDWLALLQDQDAIREIIIQAIYSP